MVTNGDTSSPPLCWSCCLITNMHLPNYYKTGWINLLDVQCYSWGGAMGHRPIQQKNGPLTTEIVILNLERMAHWNFKFMIISGKWPHTMVCPTITLMLNLHLRNIDPCPFIRLASLLYATLIKKKLFWWFCTQTFDDFKHEFWNVWWFHTRILHTPSTTFSFN